MDWFLHHKHLRHERVNEVTQLLGHFYMMLFKRFSDNQTKATLSKCHLLMNKKDNVIIRIEDTKIEISEYE